MVFEGMGHIFDNDFVLCGSIFVIHVPNEFSSLGRRVTVLLCAKGWYHQTHIHSFTTRSVAMLSEIVTRLMVTAAILSRVCGQVLVGTFGICQSHARAPIPTQTNTFGTSRCTDRYIWHMQTSAAKLASFINSFGYR